MSAVPFSSSPSHPPTPSRLCTPCCACLQISEARPLLEEQEAERHVNSESVTREAIQAVEQDGEEGRPGWSMWRWAGAAAVMQSSQNDLAPRLPPLLCRHRVH